MRIDPLPAAAIIVLIAGATLTAWRSGPAPLPPMRVVKSATCGCCAKWVEYMKKQGFTVTVEDKDEFTALKRANGVTREPWSRVTRPSSAAT